LVATVANLTSTALNTQETNYGRFTKIRLKEGETGKYIFYGKVIITKPKRDSYYGHIVEVEALDNLRELATNDVDDDITGNTTRSSLISSLISTKTWSGNIGVGDSTKFLTSVKSESSGTLDLTLTGSRKKLFDIIKDLTADDIDTSSAKFGYDFYLDTEFNGNNATPDLFYFPRGSIPVGTLPASGLTLEYAPSLAQTNQVMAIAGDYSFPRQNSEIITRVKARFTESFGDNNDKEKPRKLDMILVNHGATSGGNFAIDSNISWGSNTAKIHYVGSTNRYLVIGPSAVDTDDKPTNTTWLNTISGQGISSGGVSATVASVSANPPGSIREAIEAEIDVNYQSYESTELAAASHAASILYSSGDSVRRGSVTTYFYPYYKITGTHTGSSGASSLTDSSKTFTNLGIYSGEIIKNITDGSQATITSVGGTTIAGSLASGTDNDWDNGDSYVIPIPIRAGHSVFIKNIPSDSGISNQNMLVTKISYDEAPGIINCRINLMLLDGKGIAPIIPSSAMRKTIRDASVLPAKNQAGNKIIMGGDRGYRGLKEYGGSSGAFLSQNHFLSELGIAFQSHSGTTWAGINANGVIGINNGDTQFQIQATNGAAGFGGLSSGAFKCVLDANGATLGRLGSGDSQDAFLKLNSSVNNSNANFQIQSYIDNLLIFFNGSDNEHSFMPGVGSTYGTVGNNAYRWREVHVGPTSGDVGGTSGLYLSGKLLRNSGGTLQWDGVEVGSGVSLSGTNTWTGVNTFSNAAWFSSLVTLTYTASPTLTSPALRLMNAPALFDKGYWLTNESESNIPDPTTGYIRLYSEGNVLKYKNTSGTVVTLGVSSLSFWSDSGTGPLYPISASGQDIGTSNNGVKWLQFENAYGIKVAGDIIWETHGHHEFEADVYIKSGNKLTCESELVIDAGAFNAPGLRFDSSLTSGLYYNGGVYITVGGASKFGATSTINYNYQKVYIDDMPTISSGYVFLGTDGTGIIKEISSTIRAKMDIQDISIDTSKVYNLKAKSFRYRAQQVTENGASIKDDNGLKLYTDVPVEGADSPLQFGMIAEEVYEHIPELVSVNIKANQPIGLNYPLLSVLLLEELKKLRARIEVLEEN